MFGRLFYPGSSFELVVAYQEFSSVEGLSWCEYTHVGRLIGSITCTLTRSIVGYFAIEAPVLNPVFVDLFQGDMIVKVLVPADEVHFEVFDICYLLFRTMRAHKFRSFESVVAIDKSEPISGFLIERWCRI